ncbi:unnamed protein product [Lactuca virosa]|uniref:Retrovirus-related Pol polyprotein from transposon TNT 1-94-like beta-barrel domain-containing protein n=1 Tax=Lactuca virosa TaxID=75947 RepID=A0AAU9MNL9_9ASTR|nr:unnamed protein product [Lactuca virosa]
MSEDGNLEPSLSLQLANLLKNGINPQSQNPKLSDNLQINLKLNSEIYAIWTRMIRVAISGKSKALLSHLTSDPPSQDKESYDNGRDKLQTFNLHVRANDIKQNDSTLEEFWITLQGVWGEIDRIDPNPMKCLDDINTYARIRSEQKLFQFLNVLDQKYESIKREILRLEPLPSAEAAYATVRKEAAHQNILGTTNHTQGIAAGLVATETEGMGLATKGYRRSEGKKNGSMIKEDTTNLKCDHCGMSRHTKEQCFRLVGYPEWWADGHKKSTKGLGPEKGRAPTTDKNIDRKTATGFGGVAATGIDEEDESFSMETCTGGKKEGILKTPINKLHSNGSFSYLIQKSFENYKKNLDVNGCAIVAQNYKIKHEPLWIFDCGATDTMTYNLSDFSMSTKPTKSYIQTANGEKMNVKNGGTIEISPIRYQDGSDNWAWH